jgi:hypothetical protein
VHFSRTIKHPAKNIYIILSIFLSLSLSSCVNQSNSSEVINEKISLTNTPQEISKDYRFGNPVENDSHAQIAAQSALKTSFDYAEPLTVIKTEKMSYGEYSELIKQPLNQSEDLKVWVVIYFNDKWQSVPASSDVTPFPSFRGCVYVAINAGSGAPVEVGGPLNNGVLTDCDK